MAEDTALIKKRRELKHQLSSDEYKTLGKVITDKMGRLVQELTRNPEPYPFWYSLVVILLIITSLGLVTSLLLGEAPFSFQKVLVVIMIVGWVLILVMAVEKYVGFIFTTFHNNLVDAMESVADLADLQQWLTGTFSVRKQLFFGLAYSIFVRLYDTILNALHVGGLSFGVTFSNMILNVLSGSILYLLFRYLFLIVRLSRCQFKLYAADPSSSEVIDHLSDMLMYGVYLIAGLAAVLTLIFGSFSGLIVSGIVFLVIVIWGPLTALFLTNQYALSRIIVRAKWITLNDIQAQVEELQVQEQIMSEKAVGHIRTLIDYHNHIRTTPNSALNLRAGLNFLNSLLLPVLAFVLANVETVIAFFS